MRTLPFGPPAGPPARAARGRTDGIGRGTSVTAEQVSDDLRRHRDPYLDRRRRIAALSLLSSASMGVVAAYQSGLIRHLPEPPLPFLDAERVDASGEAYQTGKVPDAALGLVSYAVTLALATAGTARRAREHPWLPLALAAKVAVDAAGGVYLTAEQASKHRRFCSWCLVASAASVAMVPAALPEAVAALRRLAGR